MTQQQNVSETLNLAADLIEERGWVGTNGEGWNAGNDGPLCIEGAINAAIGRPSDLGIRQANTCPAGLAVRAYLDLGDFSYRSALFSWNDSAAYVNGEFVPDRTATEVVEVLRATALIEASREREAAVVAAS